MLGRRHVLLKLGRGGHLWLRLALSRALSSELNGLLILLAAAWHRNVIGLRFIGLGRLS